jgi:hypothetical protein
MTDTDDAPSDAMRRRGAESRLKLWILLEADRWAVAAGVVAVFFLGVIFAAAILPNRVIVASGDPVETLFQALVTATITGVTLVVSINSLVLSQELGTLADQRDRIEGSMSFRKDVEDTLAIGVAPSTPAAFLGELLDAIEARAVGLAAATDSAGMDAGELSDYATNLRQHATAVSADLSDSQFGTFSVVSAVLNFNYSWKIREARRLRAALSETAAPPADAEAESTRKVWESLDAIVDILTQFGAAREHIKTLYFQWELVDLSRAMLYSAVPAIVVAVTILLFNGALSTFSASTLGITHYVWLVALATSIALSPFAILLSFVLRIGTVAQRTLSIGPFILRATDEGIRNPDDEGARSR